MVGEAGGEPDWAGGDGDGDLSSGLTDDLNGGAVALRSAGGESGEDAQAVSARAAQVTATAAVVLPDRAPGVRGDINIADHRTTIDAGTHPESSAGSGRIRLDLAGACARAAEAARFELAMGFKTQTRLAGGRHRPD